MAFNFKKLLDWQRNNRLTQKGAAEKLGLLQASYAGLITGRRLPQWRTLEKICATTGLSMNELSISDDEAERLRTEYENSRPIRKPRRKKTEEEAER